MNEAKKAFENTMKGDMSFTVSTIEVLGSELQRSFGQVWAKAGQALRGEKLRMISIPRSPLGEDAQLCDVCHTRQATHTDPLRLITADASPRRETLCDRCWSLREEGKGTWVEDLAGSGYIAVAKADGDGVGGLFTGEKLARLDKSVSPSRLSAVSQLVNEVCETELTHIVESRGGRSIYAGGDDILAVLPGERAIDCVVEISNYFSNALNGACTMSTGLAIMGKNLPIYVGLEEASASLREAKSSGKNRVSVSLVGGLGLPEATKPMGWGELDEIRRLIGGLRNSQIPRSQLRQIALLSYRDKTEPDMKVKAEAWIKYQIGRGYLPPDEGEKLLGHLDSGRLSDAFTLYSLFKDVDVDG